MFDLTGKVAVVTGSSRGIGANIVRLLAAQGAKVVLNHRNSAEAAEEVAAEVRENGGEALVIQADVSQFDEAQRLVKTAIDTYGQIDILVNNAGTTRDKLIMQMKPEDWELVLQTNLSSVFNCSKACIRPMMKKRTGRIINSTSVVGLAGQAGQTNYAASKAGMIGFTKSLAKEVGSRNITVNAVAPGFIQGEWLREGLGDRYDKVMEAIAKSSALKRVCAPEDVADAIVGLISGSDLVTGHTVVVDGGHGIGGRVS